MLTTLVCSEPAVTSELANQLTTVSSATPIELRIRGHLELARADTSVAMNHAALAAELAESSTDVNLRRNAIQFYAEQLFDAGDLARAESLITALPPLVGEKEDVDWQELTARALLEVLPVWPPEAELPPPLEREALRRAYVELLDSTDPAPAIRRLFNSFTGSGK